MLLLLFCRLLLLPLPPSHDHWRRQYIGVVPAAAVLFALCIACSSHFSRFTFNRRLHSRYKTLDNLVRPNRTKINLSSFQSAWHAFEMIPVELGNRLARPSCRTSTIIIQLTIVLRIHIHRSDVHCRCTTAVHPDVHCTTTDAFFAAPESWIWAFWMH